MNDLLQSVVADRPSVSSLNATRFLKSFAPLSRPSPAERSKLIDQVYDEFCQLYDAGVEVDPDEYCARFPALQTSLRRLLDVHRELNEDSDVGRKLPARWPLTGEVFLGFHLLEELGQGTFARVFLARERAVGDRLVAVKLSQHNDHEAYTLGTLVHRNVVPILSTRYDAASGFTAVCMPFLGAATLCNVLDRLAPDTQRPAHARVLLDIARDERWSGDGAQAPARALRDGSFLDGVVYLGARLADALAYVHERKVLHRDLKPSNVLLCPNGEPVLLDFNLALSHQSAGYRLGGTLPYMPPEQLEAMGRRDDAAVPADARADLYALGVLLYELLTGAHPFGPVPLKFHTRDGCRFLLERQRIGPRRLRELNPQVDAELEALIVRCLAWDPDARPASARELADALQRYQSPLRRARRWVARHTLAAAAAATLTVTGAAAGAYELATMPSAAERHARTADEHFRQGNYQEAARSFWQAQAADPNQPDLNFKQGRAFQHMKEWSQACGEFKIALTQATEAARGRILACQGYCESQLRNHQKAIQLYKKAIEAGFDRAEVFNNLALSSLAIFQNADAKDYAATALERSPIFFEEALFNHAFAIQRLAQKALAKRGALEIDPSIGLADMQTIFAQLPGKGTQEQFETAATLCFLTLRYRGLDVSDPHEPLYQQGRNFTRLAMERGRPYEELKHCPFLGPWVLTLPPIAPANPSPSADMLNRLVDPLRGLSDK